MYTSKGYGFICYRELDQSVFCVLGYEPLSRSILEDNSIEEIKLEFPHLLFLLQELHHRVSSQFNIFAAKKKTRDKEVCSGTPQCGHLSNMDTFLCPNCGNSVQNYP